MFLDADHFKSFNDSYGHPTGDRVLVQLASTLKEAIGEVEHGLVCRYGGEEFACILPGTDRRTAAMIAENARRMIEQSSVESDDGQPLRITASIGVACFDGSVFKRAEQLIKAADQGVYAAKACGRNCVRIFTPRPKKTAA